MVERLRNLLSPMWENKVLVAAEIGINHNGDYGQALDLIQAAQACGADAVKFQVYRAGQFCNPKTNPEAYDLFKKYELSFQAFEKLKKVCSDSGIIFYATPLDFESLDFLIQIKCPIIKIASSDITNEPFLHKIAENSRKNNFHTCLSTGFADMKTIENAVKILLKTHLSLMYCVSKYPAQAADFDLNFINTLQKRFNVPIGFSDHSTGIALSCAAAGLGAKIIERHFTLDNELEGADHKISLNPEQLSALVKGVREIESALGPGKKALTTFEQSATEASMRGIYTARKISKGETIEERDLLLLRPGRGVKYSEYRSYLGKKAKRDSEAYEKIQGQNERHK
jgi:N,N'-diacetyllegionaminate synthase